MKRLLIYLFVFFGLGLTFSVSSYSAVYCVDNKIDERIANFKPDYPKRENEFFYFSAQSGTCIGSYTQVTFEEYNYFKNLFSREKLKIAKTEPSQTQKVDQLHSHLIKPDTWVYFVRIANKEFVGLSKLDAGNFLNNEKNMSNYKFDISDNLFKYQRNVGGRLRTDIRISKKLHDTLFYDNTSVLDGKGSGDGWGMGDFNLSKKKRDYLKSISTKIDDYKPYILKDLIDEYTEDNQLKNSLLAYFDKEKQIFTPKKKVKVAKVEPSQKQKKKLQKINLSNCREIDLTSNKLINNDPVIFDKININLLTGETIAKSKNKTYQTTTKIDNDNNPKFNKTLKVMFPKGYNLVILKINHETGLIEHGQYGNVKLSCEKINGAYTKYAKLFEDIKTEPTNKTQIAKTEPTVKPKKKAKVVKKEPKQEEFKPKKTNQDNEAPIIEIAETITVDSQTYTLKGKVKDKSKLYLEANGRPLKISKRGNFELEGFVVDPDAGDQIKIVAIDQWKNKSEKTINIKVEFKEIAELRSYEKPNPSKIKVKQDKNKIAIIIGIEKYKTLKNIDAPYANRDANAFRAYANRALGIPNKNIKVLIDENATRGETLKALTLWLPQIARGKNKDIYVFFAGHGLASDDGKNLYILPQDGDAALLQYTALSRLEIFDLINRVEPNSVTMFFDTCYSGQTRDERMLVAGLRPIRLVAEEQEVQNNFTIFTASNYDQTSGSIEEAKHGIFSYYLMMGMQGKADSNQDKKITNGELIAYLKQNVSEEAFINNRQQEPMLTGDPDRVLISYR